MRLLPALAAACITAATSGAATVHVSPTKAVQAIGGIEIEGVEYDVSFDGSFGQTIFLGNEAGAFAAADAINTVLNSYLNHPYFPGFLPGVDNQAGFGPNGSGAFYEITFSGSDYVRGQLMAGWAGWNPPDPSASGSGHVEAQFRLSVPGGVVHNVPEPSAALLGLAGLAFALRRRR